MARVIYIKEGRTKGYITVGVLLDEQRRAYTVPQAVYSSLGSPMPRCELDEPSLSVLDEANAEYSALKKALSLLSYSDNSYRSLVMKLRRSGFSARIAEGAALEAVRLGYIDEERQLERLILAEANGHLTGPLRLIPKLAAKGYSQDKIRAVMAELCDSGELDFDENKSILIEKKLGGDFTEEERDKLLFKHGYKTY